MKLGRYVPGKAQRAMNVREVAQRAGVSTATVSRALNTPQMVSDETRVRVLRVVEEMAYYPNVNARMLFAATNRTLGVIVSNIENPYFLDIFRGIEARAQELGYELLLANTGYRPERLAASVRLMLGRRVVGLAMVVSEIEEALIGELARSEMRVVFSGVDTPPAAFTNVKVNCRKGMEKVLTYLSALGHRRMAFVGHHAALQSISVRAAAFLDCMARFGSKLESLTFADSDSIAGGRQAARDILSSGFQPTAIVCVNDLVAIGVLKELRERGIGVPSDVSVTGFDNINFSDACNPALTTVHISRDKIAARLFESLCRSAGADAGVQDVVVDPELVVRESTGPARTS